VKRAIIIVLVLLLVLVLGLLVLRRGANVPVVEPALPPPSGITVTETSPGSSPSTNQPPKLIGEIILRDYASPNLPPQNDLTLMSHLMENSLLLLKSAANRPLSANEDWGDFLRGRNAAHQRFLSDNHASLNAKGQLVDRWKTPLFFHALGGGRFEIRSAGPDKTLWTSDDLQRNADGTFLRGSDLNPPSLFPPSSKASAAARR